MAKLNSSNTIYSCWKSTPIEHLPVDKISYYIDCDCSIQVVCCIFKETRLSIDKKTTYPCNTHNLFPYVHA